MNERPILFSAPMVRAILEGRKTVTRRVCKPAESAALSFVVDCGSGFFGDEEGDLQFACPHGKPGDRLWVRESWQVSEKYDRMPPSEMPWWRGISTYFAAGGSRAHDASGAYVNEDTICVPDWVGRMRPSIHMPRLASRILLEVVSVNVERLQDITDEQAIAEGISESDKFPGTYLTPAGDYADARVAFQRLWESTGGDWQGNPWVWAVEFKVVQ